MSVFTTAKGVGGIKCFTRERRIHYIVMGHHTVKEVWSVLVNRIMHCLPQSIS